MSEHQCDRTVVRGGLPSAPRRRMLTETALLCLVLGMGLWVEVLAPATPAAAAVAAPAISSFSPASGPIGSTVTLHGSGLTGATAHAIEASPVVANGVVYLGSDDGNLYAFDLTGGLAAPTRPEPTRLRPDYRLRHQP